MSDPAGDTETLSLFHGTRRPFKRGGLLIPRSRHGGPGTSAPLTPGRTQPEDAADWVYLTSDLDLAWVYAFHAPGRGRARVLRVTPIGDVLRDIEHGDTMAAYRCEAATVADVLTEPTVTEAEARDGWII